MNLFGYVGGNPTGNLDPLGLKCCPKSITATRRPLSVDVSTPSGKRYGRGISIQICAQVGNSADCVFRQTRRSATIRWADGTQSVYGTSPDGPGDAYVTRPSPTRICMTDTPGFPAAYVSNDRGTTIMGLTPSSFPVSFSAQFISRVQDKNDPTDGLDARWTAVIRCSSPTDCYFESR